MNRRSGDLTEQRQQASAYCVSQRLGALACPCPPGRNSRRCRVVEHVNKRGAHLKSVTEPVDHTTPAGRMFLQFLGAIAEFERALIRERSMAGQLEAMRAGKLFGRRSRLSLEVQNELVQLVGSGISLRDIGDAYGVSYTRVWTLHREAIGKPYRNLGPVRALFYANK